MKVRGVELAVREKGAGRLFLWGHGLLSSMAQEDEIGLFDWAGVSERIRLVRYDARGHGESEASADVRDYRWSCLAEDMLALADALGGGRLVLGGASMGCAAALHAAVTAPERVDALVLVIPPTAWATRARQAALYRAGARLIDTVGLAPFVVAMRAVARAGLLTGPMARAQDAALRDLAKADRRVVPRLLRGAAASDFPPEDAVAALHIPALVLAWSDDPTHPVSTAEALAARLPNVELHTANGMDDVAAWPGLVSRFVVADR